MKGETINLTSSSTEQRDKGDRVAVADVFDQLIVRSRVDGGVIHVSAGYFRGRAHEVPKCCSGHADAYNSAVQRVKRLATAVAAVIVAGVALELILRAGGYQYSPIKIGANVKDDWREQHAFHDRNLVYDPVLIWRPLSGQFSPFNPQGFRGAPIDVNKSPRTLRIFALGDSNTFGWDVDDGVNWPAQLQQLFASSRPETEVINAGVWGYTSYQGLRRFHELLPYKPDIVLVSFGANDAHQVAVSDVAYVGRHDRIESLSRATKRSRLAQLMVHGWDLVATMTNAAGSLRPRVALDEFTANLREMIRTGRDRQVQVVLLTRPFVGASADPSSWKTYAPSYNAATLALAREENVLVVDIHAAFRDQPDMFDDESHFGVGGHTRAAQIIYEALAKSMAR
jgi:lysophospholipase L1-like esterase